MCHSLRSAIKGWYDKKTIIYEDYILVFDTAPVVRSISRSRRRTSFARACSLLIDRSIDWRTTHSRSILSCACVSCRTHQFWISYDKITEITYERMGVEIFFDSGYFDTGIQGSPEKLREQWGKVIERRMSRFLDSIRCIPSKVHNSLTHSLTHSHTPTSHQELHIHLSLSLSLSCCHQLAPSLSLSLTHREPHNRHLLDFLPPRPTCHCSTSNQAHRSTKSS